MTTSPTTKEAPVMATKSQSTTTRKGNGRDEHPTKGEQQPKKQRKAPTKKFDSPAIISSVESEALTIEQIAEKIGVEVTPALKRRLAWLTERDKVLTRKVTGQ